MLKKIENYIEENKKPIVIKYSEGLSITIRPFLTIQEEIEFVNEVIENSYTYDHLENKEVYSPVPAKVAFELAFIGYFTDIPMTTKTVEVNGNEQEVYDSEKMYDICCNLGILARTETIMGYSFTQYLNKLKDNVDEAIKFKNDTLIAQSSIAYANEEAINSFGEVCNGLVDLLELANTILKKNGGKLINKISKSLTEENLNKIIDMLPNDSKDLANIINKK